MPQKGAALTEAGRFSRLSGREAEWMGTDAGGRGSGGAGATSVLRASIFLAKSEEVVS